MEQWREIDEFKGFWVSNKGRVRHNERLLKLQTNKFRRNVVWVQITIKGKAYPRRVSRLVATAFIPNPQNKGDVDHIDRNQSNNTVENLRWATRRENANNKTGRGKWPRGIIKNNDYKRFSAQTYDQNGKKVNLGLFNTLKEAKAAVDSFKTAAFGEFYRD